MFSSIASSTTVDLLNLKLGPNFRNGPKTRRRLSCRQTRTRTGLSRQQKGDRLQKVVVSHRDEDTADAANVPESVADGEYLDVDRSLVVLRDGGQPEDHDGHDQIQQVERRQA